MPETTKSGAQWFFLMGLIFHRSTPKCTPKTVMCLYLGLKVHINFIGPWNIKINKQKMRFDALTCIDPVTILTEIVWLQGPKTADNACCLFDNHLLSRYPYVPPKSFTTTARNSMTNLPQRKWKRGQTTREWTDGKQLRCCCISYSKRIITTVISTTKACIFTRVQIYCL